MGHNSAAEQPGELNPGVLPTGIRSRFVDGVNGLRVHILEAGYESAQRPRLLLLHGFPELAYSWRKVMPLLADASYHVIAPDQRGYGRTTGWDADYDSDLESFCLPNLVRDALGLVSALGYSSVAGVIGHDFGSPVAGWCALLRPDVFESVALMSAPFTGPPAAPVGSDRHELNDLHEALASLDPPRKHYQRYFSTRGANDDMWHCPQGVYDFLRAYLHFKSADWTGNDPFPLASMSAEELAKLPAYYIMDLERDMAATVAAEMPTKEQIAACDWLVDDELALYAKEYSRTGFQGGLQWYRCATGGIGRAQMQDSCGRTIDVPSVFIAGRSDWGIYQSPGALERMQKIACTQMKGCHLVDGAGHWVQQERPTEVGRLLLDFLEDLRSRGH